MSNIMESTENKIKCFKEIDKISFRLQLPDRVRKKSKCLCGGIFNYHRYIIEEKFISPTVIYLSAKYYKYYIPLNEFAKVCKINRIILLECFLKVRREFHLNRIIIPPNLMITYMIKIWNLSNNVLNSAMKLVERNQLNIYDTYLLAGVSIWLASRNKSSMKLKTISEFIHYPANKISKLTKIIKNDSNY